MNTGQSGKDRNHNNTLGNVPNSKLKKNPKYYVLNLITKVLTQHD